MTIEQSQKMELLGRMAGGVIHDINNMLAAISAYSDLLLRKKPEGDIEKGIREIRNVALRAASLTRQILNFSRPKNPCSTLVDVNAVITNLLAMLRHVVQKDIEFVTTLAPGLGRVSAGSDQIEQILLNLILNARDAMPDGGTLFIETSTVRIQRLGQRLPHVVLIVGDTGCGMDPDVLRRVFEPYFTTKEDGTGLGLATVHYLVEKIGGEIDVQSEPGQGTVFKIYLPLARVMETILLVEDEESIRNPIEKFLKLNGYTVLCAATGSEAIQACANHSGPIDLVIADRKLPESDRVQEIVATRPVLYMSGLPASEADLQKPFSIDELLARVRGILDHLPSMPT
jgi:two-component sensor histidine kinase